jgi:hypothetical protein
MNVSGQQLEILAIWGLLDHVTTWFSSANESFMESVYFMIAVQSLIDAVFSL